MISNQTQEIIQKKKANELREELLKNGFYVNQPNTSITNFGISTYIGFYDEFNVYRKFRISDHSVTNLDRVFNEYHYNENTDIEKLVESVKKDIEVTKKKVSDWNDLHEQDKKRTELANEKWERIKNNFDGLCFKVNNRTYQDLEKFSENTKRSNIFQKALDNNRYGETPYYYEWTEPKTENDYCNSKPSREFIEQFNEVVENIIGSNKEEIVSLIEKDFATKKVADYLTDMPADVKTLFSYLDNKFDHKSTSVGMPVKFDNPRVRDFFHLAQRAINGRQYGDNDIDHKAIFIKKYGQKTYDAILKVLDNNRIYLKNGGFISIDTSKFGAGKIERIVFMFPQIYSGVEANVDLYLKLKDKQELSDFELSFISEVEKIINKADLDNFDWESFYRESTPEEKAAFELKQKEEAENEKENWYQQSKWSKKYAPTYKDAVEKTKKEYLDSKKTFEDWGSRVYKSNKDVVYAGGDDIHGDAYTIGGINENRKRNVLKGAKMQMDEAIANLKELHVPEAEINELVEQKENKDVVGKTLTRVLNGEINSDEAAIEIDKSGIEVDAELYDELRAAEVKSKGKRELWVGDTIIVKGKNGNKDFEANFRGYTNDGKLIVVYGGGNQMSIGKEDYYEKSSEPENKLLDKKENKEINIEEVKLIDTINYNVDGDIQLKEIYEFGYSNIQLLYTLENKNLFQIAGLFVAEKDRRNGVGSKLIDFAKKRAAELQFDEILYLVADYEGKDYDDLVSFCKKNGFEFVGKSDKKMIFKLSKENKEMAKENQIVNPVNEWAIEINELYDQWIKIKTDADWQKWKENVKSKKYGTYKNKDVLDILDNFEPNYPNDVIKKDWITELHKALNITLPAHLKGQMQKAIDNKIEVKENKGMKNIKLEIQEYIKDDAFLTKKLNKKISDSEFSKIQEIRSENGKKIMKNFVNHFNLEKGQVYRYNDNKGSDKYEGLKYMALLAIHMNNFIEFDYFDEDLKIVKNNTHERFYSNDLMKLFDLFDENKITLLNDYNYVKTSEETGEYKIIAPPKELTEDEKNWASITDKFNQVYFEDSSSEKNMLTSDQVKATEYAWQFDKYSKYKSTLSWEAAEKKFKESLTKEELDSIEISYKKDKYADLEQHDTEKYHRQIFVKQKMKGQKKVAFPEDLNYQYTVIDEDKDNYLVVQDEKLDLFKKAKGADVLYYQESVPKSEMVEVSELENTNITDLKEIPNYSKYADKRSWDAAFSNLKGLQKKSKKVFDKVIGMIYSIPNPTDNDITHIVNKTNDHSKIFDRFDSFYDNEKWMAKFDNANESTLSAEQEKTLIALEKIDKEAEANWKEEKKKNTPKNVGINSEVVENWSEVPVVWKNTKPVSKVNFVNTPYNKELIKLLDAFAGNDALRPVMSGIHFDGNGITATNAHKLITLPYPNPEYNGTYATIPKRDYSQDKDIKDDLFVSTKYPNYEAVTPKAEAAIGVYEFSVYKALQYIRVALKFANKVTNQIAFSFGDTLIAFNGEFLSEMLETALKLGHTKLFSFTTAPYRAIVLSPDRNYEIGKSEIFLLMPVMIVNDDVNYKGGAMDLDFNREIKVYYDFATDSIYNADGTLAEFKMNYGEYDILKPNEIKALDKYAGNNNTIPVLDNFKVEEGKVFANNLDTIFTIKDSDLKDGLYRVINGAIEYNANDTLSSFEDYPKIIIEGDVKLSFIINSEVLKFYLEKAIEFTGDDDLRPVMKGICFDYNNGQMFMVATDAHKMFRVDITEYISEIYDKKDFQFILSQSNLMKFLKVLDESPIEVKAYNKNVAFDTDDYNFTSKTIDGKYPNYNSVISAFKNKKITINVKDLFICLKSKEAQDFIKKHKKEDVMLIDRAGSKENELDLYLFVFEDTRDNSSRKIEDEVKICTVKYKYEEGTYQTHSNVMLLMPIMNNEDAAHFAFREKFFREILDVVNCEDVEIFYDEKNRAYLIDGDCFKYKHTIQAVKKSPVKTSVVEEVRTEKEIVEQEEKDKEVIEEQFNEPDADLIDSRTTGAGTSDAEDAIVLLNDLLEDAKGKQKKTILEAINLLKDLL
jgi:GNAT superfamily N-acetyltransferase